MSFPLSLLSIHRHFVRRRFRARIAGRIILGERVDDSVIARVHIEVRGEHVFCNQGMTHGPKLSLAPLNFTELCWTRRSLRTSEEHFVVLGKVLSLVSNRSYEMIDHHRFDVTKIRVPAVFGHRIFVRTFLGKFGSCKFLSTTKLINSSVVPKVRLALFKRNISQRQGHP